MSQSSGQSLQFSINESVWLRDGEEVEEILSMALEPDITIEENTHYVTIKGALRLSGEYKPTESNEEEGSIEDYGRPSFRTIDEVTETDVGTSLMEHRFPVDITIPSGRIADIDDVYVTVESFDYQLPEKGCIQLEAEITISGLVDEDRQEEEPTPEIADVSYDPSEVTAFASYREPENEETDSDSPQIEMKQRPEEDIEQDVFENFFEDDEEEKFAKEPAFRNDTGHYHMENPYDEEPDAVHPYLHMEPEAVPVDSSYVNDWEEDNTDEEAHVVHTRRRNENALYLTKMLTNEEDQFTKVKVCIVQDGDSLETLSERYEVPITTILRRNRLESDSVDEGQVLYIPVTKKG